MVAASKIQLGEVLLGRTCKEIVHPWTDSCATSNLSQVWRGTVGSFRFFLPFYLVHLVQRRREWSSGAVLDTVKGLVRSTVFGAAYSTIIMFAHCSLRQVLGRYNGFTGILLPAILGGLSMFLDDPSHWTITTLIFVNMLLEWLLYVVQERAGVWLGSGFQTAGFMVLSGAVLYMLRSGTFRKHASNPGLWFFKPPRVTSGHARPAPCPHQGPCWKSILQDASQYLRAGIGFQMLRVISKFLVRGSKPSALLSKLCARDNFMLGAFLGSYVAIYKMTSCMLCRWQGRDEAVHAALAGFLAGAAFHLHPDATIGISVLTTILQLLASRALDAASIARVPAFNVLLTAFCGGLLVNARYANQASVPRLMLACIHMTTSARTTEIYRRMQAIQKTLGV